MSELIHLPISDIVNYPMLTFLFLPKHIEWFHNSRGKKYVTLLRSFSKHILLCCMVKLVKYDQMGPSYWITIEQFTISIVL